MTQPSNPDGLPRQRRGITPQMHGRYPDFDCLEQGGHWDEVTRRVVVERVDNPPAIRFFTAEEADTLKAFCDTVMAQDREPRIPVLSFIDEKMHLGLLDGFRYADMPDDPETWRRVARGLDEMARRDGAADSFAAAADEARRKICGRFAKGELHGGAWEELPAPHAWAVVMRSILEAFYSHPWAWNEIGFGGPAYPRGYMNLGIDAPEPWEGEEAFEVDPVSDVPARGLQ